MQDKNVFDPEKINLIDFKMLKGQVDAPENFEITHISGHHLDHSFQVAFDMEGKLAKADFIVKLHTESGGRNKSEATGNFHFIFIYRIDNLDLLAHFEQNNKLVLNPVLPNVLASVSYSTSRGILLTRLQGTALQNFILPIINPDKLLGNVN